MRKGNLPIGNLRETPNRRPRDGHLFFRGRYWLRDLILAALMVLVVTFFVYQPVEVEGISMLPGIGNHERVFVNKIIYHVEPIRRGDIIVFHYPVDPAKTLIKRVIGLPGDWVSIKNGHVFVNGKPLKENYIPPGYLGHSTCAPVHITPHHYYVLGDHRAFSDDSRVWGTVDRKYIYGEASFAYWPPDDIGPVK